MSAGTQKDEIANKTFVGDDRSCFQRGEHRAFRLRKAKVCFDERVGRQCCIDGLHELFKPGMLQRGKQVLLRHRTKGGPVPGVLLDQSCSGPG